MRATGKGKPAEALSVAERLLTTTPRRSGEEQPIPWLLKLKGEALLALSRGEEAIAALESALEGAKQRHETPIEWQISVSLGQACWKSGRVNLAELQYASARQLITTLADSLDNMELREHFMQAASAHLPMEAQRARGTAQDTPGGLHAARA